MMLVLTVRKGDRILIGSDVVLDLIELRPGQIRLGIAAPIAQDIQRRPGQSPYVKGASHAATASNDDDQPR